MADWLLSIGTGTAQRPLILAARAQGWRVLGIDRAPDRQLCDDALPVSTYDADAATAALRAWVAAHALAPQAVLARTSGPAIMTAARVAALLDLPGCGLPLAEASVSKYALYRQCDALGVAAIASAWCDPAGDQPFPFPFVVKPDQPLRGKENVYCVGDREQLLAAWQGAAAESVNGACICQPLVDGAEFGLVTACRDGELLWQASYAERVALADGKYRGRGVVGPCRELPPELLAQALAGARRLLADWRCTGFCFFSFRVDAAGVARLFEVNPGLCGDQIVDRLFPAMWPGSDFFALDVALMSGAAPVFPAGEGIWSEVGVGNVT